LSTALQQFAKRRIGENKIKTTVDDILNIWSTIDEKGALDKLQGTHRVLLCYLINFLIWPI